MNFYMIMLKDTIIPIFDILSKEYNNNKNILLVCKYDDIDFFCNRIWENDVDIFLPNCSVYNCRKDLLSSYPLIVSDKLVFYNNPSVVVMCNMAVDFDEIVKLNTCYYFFRDVGDEVLYARNIYKKAKSNNFLLDFSVFK